MHFDRSKNSNQNKKLSKDEISNLPYKRSIPKYKEMVRKQEQIKDIKRILLRVDGEIVQLLEENIL